MEQLCEELDQTLLELMGSLQLLAEVRKKYTMTVSEGYFNLAKARYSMPPQSVGALQYDSVMTPLVHVETSWESLSAYEELPAAEYLEFTARRSGGERGRQEKKTAPDETGQQLRRRKPAVAESRRDDSIEDLIQRGGAAAEKDASSVTGKEEEAGPGREQREGGVKDPLRWFGVLAPHSLRHSQQCFTQAVAHCAELAGLQAKVETLRRRYLKLLLEKKQISA